MVPPRRYDSSTSVTASRLFSRPPLSSIRFSQSPRTRPLLAAYGFLCSPLTHGRFWQRSLFPHTALLAAAFAFLRSFPAFPFAVFPLSAASRQLSLHTVACCQFSHLLNPRAGFLVAAIALSLLAYGSFWGAFHSPFTISSHAASFPSHVVPRASRFRLFLQPSTFAFTHGRLSAAFSSGSRPARGCVWQLLSFPSLLTHVRLLPTFDFSVLSHTVPCGSLRLLASHLRPLWASIYLSQSLRTRSHAASSAPFCGLTQPSLFYNLLAPFAFRSLSTHGRCW